MHLVLTRRLSVCVYVKLCYYISMYYLPYFPSKKIYVFVRECGVSVNRATCTTLCVFEINKPRRLQRRNHKKRSRFFRLLFCDTSIDIPPKSPFVKGGLVASLRTSVQFCWISGVWGTDPAKFCGLCLLQPHKIG